MSAHNAAGGIDPLADLPRLGDEALGPCALCDKVILATGMPIFYRLTVQHCGVDAKAVQQRVGLAMAMGGGEGGLALSGIMGARKAPVVEMSKGQVNVCMACAQAHPSLLIARGAAIEGGAGD